MSKINKITTPKVFLIGCTSLEMKALDALMLELGESAFDWWCNHLQNTSGDDAETLIEVAGRMCYKSFGAELNKNLTRIRDDSKAYINNIMASRHGSVLEHGTVTFAVLGASRIFTHELVRHRPNSYSQESGRFVVLDSINFYWPTAFDNDLTENERALVDESLNKSAETFHRLYNRLTQESDLPFSEKKKLTSALRRILPSGIASDIIFTANHRGLRHMIETRTAPGAEEEIRIVFGNIARMLKSKYQYIYQDMSDPHDLLNPRSGFTFEHSKI